jgi:ABC-2 type transport system ATP-binding protein
MVSMSIAGAVLTDYRVPRSADAPVAVRASGLVKTFGATPAVKGVDLIVCAGTVYGLLGPNGAGKTTTIRMLATLLRPDGGSAQVLGHDVVREADAVRRRISLTGQFASVDGDLTGLENLILLARLQGYSRPRAKERSRDLLDAFGLSDAAGRLAKTYSGGMRRRLDIAASVVVTPDLLFLDEPTTGLDPASRNEVWALVRSMVARGTTVVLTTQYLDEADQLADRIAVMKDGKVIVEGTSGALKASVGSGILQLRLDGADRRPQAARLLQQVLDVRPRLESDPVALSARLSDRSRVGQVLEVLSRESIAVAELAFGQPSLDEVFLALTGEVAASNEEDGR